MIFPPLFVERVLCISVSAFVNLLRYNSFVSFYLRSLIESLKTIDLKMHKGWYELPFKNNLLTAVSLMKLVVKNQNLLKLSIM